MLRAHVTVPITVEFDMPDRDEPVYQAQLIIQNMDEHDCDCYHKGKCNQSFNVRIAQGKVTEFNFSLTDADQARADAFIAKVEAFVLAQKPLSVNAVNYMNFRRAVASTSFITVKAIHESLALTNMGSQYEDADLRMAAACAVRMWALAVDPVNMDKVLQSADWR